MSKLLAVNLQYYNLAAELMSVSVFAMSRSVYSALKPEMICPLVCY